ncbi:hypothetical protein [Roseicella aquatilis]|uniref:hypothetical protein n=1 Tax=Roseicella aquatilis TaxID=2527868 RepID=UPI001049B035|nr:hypothetical protein [Roseicella aquatilis]
MTNASAARPDAALLALAAELHAAEVAELAAVRRLSATEGTEAEREAQAAQDAAFAAWDGLVRRMAALPAETSAGIAVKAARLARVVHDGATAADAMLAASVARDVARFAPEAAPLAGAAA